MFLSQYFCCNAPVALIKGIGVSQWEGCNKMSKTRQHVVVQLNCELLMSSNLCSNLWEKELCITRHPYNDTRLTLCDSGFTLLRHIREVLALVVKGRIGARMLEFDIRIWKQDSNHSNRDIVVEVDN